MLLMAIEVMYPGKRLIHVFLDNARYHHAKLVQQWLARAECRIRLHFIPSYCPHLDPIERLWGLMHRHTTHNKCYAGFKDFSRAVLTFLREKVPGIGMSTATRSPTTSASSIQEIFGFSREPGIAGEMIVIRTPSSLFSSPTRPQPRRSATTANTFMQSVNGVIVRFHWRLRVETAALCSLDEPHDEQ